jgi:hypothetical protein
MLTAIKMLSLSRTVLLYNSPVEVCGEMFMGTARKPQILSKSAIRCACKGAM